MRIATAVAAGQLFSGAALLLRPTGLGRLAAGGAEPPPPAIVRLLGGRMAAQGLLLLGRVSDGRAFRVGAAVDGCHAASMVAAAAAFPRFRRAAAASAAIAFAMAAFETKAAR